MAGRGRGRASAANAGQGAGRGSGLQRQPPTPTPPASLPPAPEGPSAGRGRARSQPTASTSGPSQTRGRGRGVPAENPPVASGPGLSESSAAPGPSHAEPATPPVKAIEVSLSDLRLGEPPLYRRPAKGVKCQKMIKLQSNLYKVELSGTTWYKYDVEISTKADPHVELSTAAKATNKDRIQSRHLNRVIMQALFDTHKKELRGHWPAYDGRKTLICAEKFFDEHVFTVDLDENERGRRRSYVVKLKLALDIDVTQVNAFYENRQGPLNVEVLQAANIVIDSALGREFVAVNRSYYSSNQTLRGNPSLSGGKELRSGVYTSMIFAQWKPLLVVDKANTAFYKSGDLIDYIVDFLGVRKDDFIRRGLGRDQKSSLSKDLKGLVVRLKHARNGRCVKIYGLSDEPACRIEFPIEGGGRTNVANYFNERYHDTYGQLKYPNLPCVTVVRANGTKTDYYPLEVCEIKPNQPYKKKLNPLQTANMIKNCQEGPYRRIQQSIENVGVVNRTSKRVLGQHGVSISERPVETVGLQIRSPMIQVKAKQIQPSNGSWRQDNFHEGARLTQWCVVDCAGVGPLAGKLADLVYNLAQKYELQNVGRPPGIINGTNKGLHDIFREVKRMHEIQKGPMLAVFILGTAPLMYSQIKRMSETQTDFRGIITQCIRGENIRNERKFSPMFVSNVLKKINAKLGGINNAITVGTIPHRFKNKPFIVIGADVSHPGVGDFMTPSIAAIVGSTDYIPSKYWTEIRVQKSESSNRIEYIEDLEEVAMILLKQHRKATNRIPEHIYYIRDGVSDGQFDEVRKREINALRRACSGLNRDYKPMMTVVIAQKRHHVRFNVMNPQDGTGREKNVPPGTYIDRDVVHPENFDFYMYTHQGLLGCSRPTHYHLIHSDDETFTTDEITEIINHLCYVYARTTSPVSIPAPIYYAHLAAFRAKEHVKGNLTLSGSDSRSVSSGGEGVAIDLSEYQKTCNVDLPLRGNLYYA